MGCLNFLWLSDVMLHPSLNSDFSKVVYEGDPARHHGSYFVVVLQGDKDISPRQLVLWSLGGKHAKKHHCFETCQRNLCVRGTLEHFRDWVKLRKLSNKPRKLINSYQFMVWLLASAYFKSPYLKTRADDPDLCWWHQSPVQSHRLACESIFLNWCDLTIGKAFLFGCTVAPLNFPLKQSIEKSVTNCDIAGIAWLLQRTNPSCWAPWRAKAELLSVPWAKKIRGFALSHMV